MVFRRYGGNRILTINYGDMEITSFNVVTRQVTACDLHGIGDTIVFQLPQHATSDYELFGRTILARWEELKSRWKDDEDYTDYLPALYDNLNDLSTGNCRIIKGTLVFSKMF